MLPFNRSYNYFCACGKQIDARLASLEARQFVPRRDVNKEDWGAIDSWLRLVIDSLDLLKLQTVAESGEGIFQGPQFLPFCSTSPSYSPAKMGPQPLFFLTPPRYYSAPCASKFGTWSVCLHASNATLSTSPILYFSSLPILCSLPKSNALLAGCLRKLTVWVLIS